MNSLTLSFSNNVAGNRIYAYVIGKDITDAVVVLTTNGTWYYPNPAGSTSPVEIDSRLISIPIHRQGLSSNITIPKSFFSGRILVSEGKSSFYTVAARDGTPQLVEPPAFNPNSPSAKLNWGFVEVTITAEGLIYANISYVDFVGLILGLTLTLSNGNVQTVAGLPRDAVAIICDEMRALAEVDNMPWSQMCITAEDGTPLRILAPNTYEVFNPGATKGYFAGYVEEVWNKYSSQDLVIDTQDDVGLITCRVTSNELLCDGDNRGYARPSEVDIWGCNSGPFALLPTDNSIHRAVVPRLCAAFTRSTLLIEGGDVQPAVGSEHYYLQSPTSHYSRIVHEHELDGKGYAFSYDDVGPEGYNTAGVVAGTNPHLLQIAVGGSFTESRKKGVKS